MRHTLYRKSGIDLTVGRADQGLLTNTTLTTTIGHNTPAMPLHSGASTNCRGFFYA